MGRDWPDKSAFRRLAAVCGQAAAQESNARLRQLTTRAEEFRTVQSVLFAFVLTRA